MLWKDVLYMLCCWIFDARENGNESIPAWSYNGFIALSSISKLNAGCHLEARDSWRVRSSPVSSTQVLPIIVQYHLAKAIEEPSSDVAKSLRINGLKDLTVPCGIWARWKFSRCTIVQSAAVDKDPQAITLTQAFSRKNLVGFETCR